MLTPNSPPSLLARVLADGPERDFLDAVPGDLRTVPLPGPAAGDEGWVHVGDAAVDPVADGKQIEAEAGAINAVRVVVAGLSLLAGVMLSYSPATRAE